MPVSATAKSAEFALMTESVLQHLRDGLELAEIAQPTISFARQEGVERKLKVVRPLRAHAEASLANGACRPRIGSIALRDQLPALSELRRGLLHLVRQLGQKRKSSVVFEGLHGVEPQAVSVVVLEPAEGVVDE